MYIFAESIPVCIHTRTHLPLIASLKCYCFVFDLCIVCDCYDVNEIRKLARDAIAPCFEN